MSQEFHQIKPAGRIITAIGSDLIKDVPAAIVELVKNSYDADASLVSIIFEKYVEHDQIGLKLMIIDDGHGMDGEKVKNAWLVPATSDKKIRKYSPSGRLMQGKKGLGRYASAILGSKFRMTTTSREGETTIVTLDWSDFEKTKYLEDIEVAIETNSSRSQPGTCLEIIGDDSKLSEWTESKINELIIELQKLLIPVDFIDDFFSIKLIFREFGFRNEEVVIAPFPLLDLYDYRLHGYIENNGQVFCVFENKSQKGIPDVIVKPFKAEIIGDGRYCGRVEFDFRVFDKDSDSLTELIQRGNLRSENGKELRKNEVKKMLKEISGISIYRENFRIRPYGDTGYDWLELDKKRVQNPAGRIGSDQIAGIVKIQEEDLSNLEEKSARDGLKENGYYSGLVQVISRCLRVLEDYRYDFRDKTGKGRRQGKTNQDLDQLLDFSKMTQSIESKLHSLNIDRSHISDIQKIIKDTENEKSALIQEIRDAIAVYQGQATLGKIVEVILHEGRKPISWLRNQPKTLTQWIKELGVVERNEVEETDQLEKIFDRLETSKEEAEKLAILFKKIDPLSVGRRGKRRELNIGVALSKSLTIFESDFEQNGITVQCDVDSDLVYFGWQEDLVMSLTNIIQNSVYWLSNYDGERRIWIDVFREDEINVIEIRDSGPGIEKEDIESEKIFIPGYSTKPNGTGLGVAIAGEAIERIKGKLIAVFVEDGACFRIELKGVMSGEELNQFVDR